MLRQRKTLMRKQKTDTSVHFIISGWQKGRNKWLNKFRSGENWSNFTSLEITETALICLFLPLNKYNWMHNTPQAWILIITHIQSYSFSTMKANQLTLWAYSHLFSLRSARKWIYNYVAFSYNLWYVSNYKRNPSSTSSLLKINKTHNWRLTELWHEL